MTTDLNRRQLLDFTARERDHYEELLKAFVEIPTVSADPEHKADIQKCVELAVETIRQFEGETRVYQTNGNPVVQGVFKAGKNLPTVTIYNHMDVQPASKETEPWDTEPFAMTSIDNHYFGRGTTDDKGPALAALFGTRAAQEAAVPINLQLLWEFEEEIGSPNFYEVLARNADELATNSIIVSDTGWISRDRPAAPSGLRGIVSFRLTLETGLTDRHSGEVGGAARNPLGELMQVICDLYDPITGEVKVPGFYDDLVEPTASELQDFLNSGFSVSTFQRDHSLTSLRTQVPIEVMKRIWTSPTFEVHGVAGGYSGPGMKSIVPQQAEVKASCRLVPDQQPENIAALIRSFVQRKNPDVQFRLEGLAIPYKGATRGPFVEALKTSVKFAFGRELAFIRDGGTIGAVLAMEKVLQCPVMFLGLSLPEHGYHAPNENFDWTQASGGMIAFAKYFKEISELSRLQ